MNYLLICLTSFFASALTFFSGFGLGTLLMPAFALFFPVDLAIGMTAVVHLLNNLFKLILVGRLADKDVVLRFGSAAISASFVGALCLSFLASHQPLFTYSIGARVAEVTALKILIAALMVLFATIEVLPSYQTLAFDQKYLAAGGLVSGFFGGLSGHQGALRSAFLIRAGLTKETFIATGVVIAVLVDLARIGVYLKKFLPAMENIHFPLMAAATGSAFLGAWLGNRFLKKMAVHVIQWIVSTLLLLIALALAVGVI